jgi:pimeloyl-ACP methyl ester carboxylesterase
MRKRTSLTVLGFTAALATGTVLALPASASATASSTAPSRAASAVAGASSVSSPGQKPTIVLVHGAWADSGSWADVIVKLRKDGYPVRAASDPLRGIASDAASVRSLVDSINGPVVLVGHSYGGAVISAAAAGDSKVKSLVYLAAFVPTKGETIGELSARKVANPVPPASLVTVATSATTADVYLDPAKFRATFAGDVSKREAGVLAATQRPVAAAVFGEKATTSAQANIPAYYLVTTKDQAIAPETQRFMAKRAGARISRISSSHAVMVSHPLKVVRLIETAAH